MSTHDAEQTTAHVAGSAARQLRQAGVPLGALPEEAAAQAVRAFEAGDLSALAVAGYVPELVECVRDARRSGKYLRAWIDLRLSECAIAVGVGRDRAVAESGVLHELLRMMRVLGDG